MEIRAEEISQIIRSQIRDYEKKVEVAETGTVLSVVTASPGSMAWRSAWPWSSWNSPGASLVSP